jgi:hypothetical protein
MNLEMNGGGWRAVRPVMQKRNPDFRAPRKGLLAMSATSRSAPWWPGKWHRHGEKLEDPKGRNKGIADSMTEDN